VRARDVIDYALQRRARLTEVATGRASTTEVCDAHPYLLLAARHYGEPTMHACPICTKHNVRLVHYVYGDALGKSAGQAKSVGELQRMDSELPEFTVYAVEVCPDCQWNHLARSFVLGHEDPMSTAADG